MFASAFARCESAGAGKVGGGGAAGGAQDNLVSVTKLSMIGMQVLTRLSQD